jgi:hypothetical protein
MIEKPMTYIAKLERASKTAEMHAVALVAMSNDHKEALENMRQIEDHRHAEIMDMQNLLAIMTAYHGTILS